MIITLIVSGSYYWYLNKKDKLINLSKIRQKRNCGNCGCNLYSNREELLQILGSNLDSKPFRLKNFISFTEYKDIRFCKSCNRDKKIAYLNGDLSYLKYDFKRMVLSLQLEKLIVFSFIPLFISIIAMIFKYHDLNHIASILNSSILIIYWSLQLYRNVLITKIKIPSD
jgi:hypothetical protein